MPSLRERAGDGGGGSLAGARRPGAPLRHGPHCAAGAGGLRLAGPAAGAVPGGAAAADPRLADDAEDHPQRGAQDRRVPQRGARPAGRRGRPLPVQVQRRIKALYSLRI